MEKEIQPLSTVAYYSLKAFVVLLSAFFIAVSVSSCHKLEDYTTEEVWVISPKTEKKIIREFGEEEFECMIITSIFPSRSEPFYIPLGRIRGFEYQVGYEYKIEIFVIRLANPPQDSSNKTYAIKRVLSQEKV